MQQDTPSKNALWRIVHVPGERLGGEAAIDAASGEPSGPEAMYRYSDSLPKPCIHPLRTPAGRLLSGFEPSDHRWHRGLWFTIKFVNEQNFWEENPPFGTQRSIAGPTISEASPTDYTIRHDLAWLAPEGEQVIREARQIHCTWQQPDGAAPILAIDWSCVLHAERDLTLDRTPFTTWGGYGGLAFRSTRELHKVRYLAPDGSTPEAVTGESHAWLAMDGQLDGGPACFAGIAMFDHPDNPRWPTPFYAKSNNGFSYINPTFLFHEPMTLAAGEELSLGYRVLVKDGRWEKDELATAGEQFTASPRPLPVSTQEVSA